MFRHMLARILAIVLATLPALYVTPAAAQAKPGEPGYIPTVIVTGANRGIGLALAQQYLARGYRVIATARKPAEATELNRLAAASKGLFIVEQLDVMDLDAIDALAVQGPARRRGHEQRRRDRRRRKPDLRPQHEVRAV
jgi:hypothetical protein